MVLLVAAIDPPSVPKLRVHFIDIGQGAATLVEFPCGAMLIDTGGEENAEFHSTPALIAYLDAFFARRTDLAGTLDVLLLTHPHIDHVRGAPAVLEHYPVRTIVEDGRIARQDDAVAAMARVREYVAGHPDVAHLVVRLDDFPSATGPLDSPLLDRFSMCQGVDPTVVALWGGVDADRGWGDNDYGSAHFDNDNNHSVVTRVDFGAASVLLPGDMEIPGLRGLVTDRGPLLDVDVLQVGHHGSHNGTTPDLLRAVSPEFAVMAVGPAARRHSWTAWQYGHPRAALLDLLEAHVTGTRTPVVVPIGSAMKTFSEHTVDRAVYATAWDGTVVLEATAAGDFGLGVAEVRR